VGSPEDPETARYYKGLSFLALGEINSAIETFENLISAYPEGEYVDEAWDEIVFMLWAYQGEYEAAADFALQFADRYPSHEDVPEFLYYAGRIRERNNDLVEAAEIWDRNATNYPQSGQALDSIFQSAIALYRLGNYNEALAMLQRFSSASADFPGRATAEFWIGKVYQAQGDDVNARGAWERAANLDPTGYYSERAQDYLAGRDPFQPPTVYDIGVDLISERQDAAQWVRTQFGYPEDLEVITPGPLYDDPRFQRGTEFWRLGEYELAKSEFESLRIANINDALNSFRLANYYLDIGLYRSAIFAARSVLDQAGMNDASTLTAPKYFNHVRFGTYYIEIVQPVADAYGFHPLLLWSVMRQESLFEGFVRSSAGARGLMQIIPSTGEAIQAQAGWPPNYTAEDLYRPKVSITFGADYLADQRTAFDGDLHAALAAYNGGPGNSFQWKSISQDDPDLFVEVIRFEETRRYLRAITEIFSIYRDIYDRSP
jgi:soluble lytic murein transglycosylase